MVDAPIGPAGASPIWVRSSCRPVVHPRCVVQFAIAGFETPTVIELTYWPGSNIAPDRRTGREREPAPRRHKIARPVPWGAGEFIGRAQGLKDSAHPIARLPILKLACPVWGRASNHAHVNAPQPWDCLGLRMMRDLSKFLNHTERCGWRAAQASIAHDIPRSSCCPGGHV
jgi:hypothetical protein